MLHDVTRDQWFKLRQRYWRETNYGEREPTTKLQHRKRLMTAFDPLRAAREELMGLNDVHKVLKAREQKTEEAMSFAENELNAIRKITGYVRISMETIALRIAELEREKQ